MATVKSRCEAGGRSCGSLVLHWESVQAWWVDGWCCVWFLASGVPAWVGLVLAFRCVSSVWVWVPARFSFLLLHHKISTKFICIGRLATSFSIARGKFFKRNSALR